MSAGETIAFAVTGLGAAALLMWWGVHMLRVLTLALEGHYEFHGDTLTRRSRLGGFVRFFIWAVVAATAWSFWIDWIWFEDFGFAMAALMVRLQWILHILAELADD
jgi:hypothetical protein